MYILSFKILSVKHTSSARPASGCVLLRPLAANPLGVLLVLLVVLGDVGCEGIVRVGRAEERLHGEQDGADLQRRRPLV